MPEHLQIVTVPATIAARLSIWFLAGYAFWQGTGIWADGPDRFSGPSFSLLRLVNGSGISPTAFWGGWLIAAGIILLIASIEGLWWMKLVALVGVAVWSSVFAVGSWVAAHSATTTPGTGYKTYALVVLFTIPLAFVDERRQHDHARY